MSLLRGGYGNGRAKRWKGSDIVLRIPTLGMGPDMNIRALTGQQTLRPAYPACLIALLMLGIPPALEAQDPPRSHVRLEVGRYTIHDKPPIRGGRPSGLALGAHFGRRLSEVMTLDFGLTHGSGSRWVVQGQDPAQDRKDSFSFTALELSAEVRLLPGSRITPVLAAGGGLMQEYDFSTASLTYFGSIGLEVIVAARHALRLTLRRGAHPNLGDPVSSPGPHLVSISWIRAF